MQKILFFAAATALLLAGCAANQGRVGGMASKVSFKTSDGISISALHYANPGKPGVILFPMLGRTKETWGDFASELQKNGFDVLAIEPRGHGESAGGDWQSFSAEEFNNMVLDVQAAQTFLGKQQTFVIGASIGANTALKYASQNPSKTEGVVLLSPGLNYRGVDVSQTLFKGRVLVAASKEDEYSFASSRQIAENNGAEFLEYEGLGHGTAMLSSSGLRKKIISFLQS